MGFWSQATPAPCCDVVESHHGSPTRALNLEPQDLARSQIKASNISEPQVSPLWNLKINACLPARATNLTGEHWGQMAWEQVWRCCDSPSHHQVQLQCLCSPQSALPGAPSTSLQLQVSAYLASHLLAQLTTPFFSNPLSLGCCDTTLAPILCSGSSAQAPLPILPLELSKSLGTLSKAAFLPYFLCRQSHLLHLPMLSVNISKWLLRFSKLSFSIAEKYSMVWIYHSLFCLSPTEGHLDCFQFGKGAISGSYLHV